MSHDIREDFANLMAAYETIQAQLTEKDETIAKLTHRLATTQAALSRLEAAYQIIRKDNERLILRVEQNF